MEHVTNRSILASQKKKRRRFILLEAESKGALATTSQGLAAASFDYREHGGTCGK